MRKPNNSLKSISISKSLTKKEYSKLMSDVQ